MIILTKHLCYIVYSLIITIFMCYVDVLYYYNYYMDWLFWDFKNNSNFDLIIVGAGSAGSVIASKFLNSTAKILLIEAGGPPIYFFDIPVIAPLLVNTFFDWQYKTVPQKNACLGLYENRSAWTAGKILGGSSRLNNMIYAEGHSYDYNWFPEWKKRIVGQEKLLHVHDQNWHSKLTDFILEGIVEMSHPLNDINRNSSTGFMRAPLTLKNGQRWSLDQLLYQRNHKKLKILTNSFVQKIIFKKKKAIGVRFLKNGKIFTAYSKKGIIISAGAVGTPKLLMLSGIGPKKHLSELNIKTVTDLPVGQNLQDHIITGLDLVTIEKNVALGIADILNPYSLMEYYLLGKGPWTSGGVDVIGTFHSKYQNKSLVPDLQIMTFPVGISQDNGVLLRKNLHILENIFNEYFEPLVYKTAVTIAPVLLHPKSFGDIKLKSSDPLDPPLIDPKYLSKDQDVLTLVEGIKFIKKLVNTKSMKKIGAKFYKKTFPGCETFKFDTIDYWKCYVKHLTLTTYHPVGTCKMGKVVDKNFRVLNTRNLFIVDASVFPRLPSGNINAPIVRLAEKAANIIYEHIYDIDKNKCFPFDIFLLYYKCI